MCAARGIKKCDGFIYGYYMDGITFLQKSLGFNVFRCIFQLFDKLHHLSTFFSINILFYNKKEVDMKESYFEYETWKK